MSFFSIVVIVLLALLALSVILLFFKLLLMLLPAALVIIGILWLIYHVQYRRFDHEGQPFDFRQAPPRSGRKQARDVKTKPVDDDDEAK